MRCLMALYSPIHLLFHLVIDNVVNCSILISACVCALGMHR